jgi:hypothetical protein
MLKHAQQGRIEHRPFFMEAVIRGGSDKTAVFDAINATPAERERVEELLAGPSVWRRR